MERSSRREFRAAGSVAVGAALAGCPGQSSTGSIEVEPGTPPLSEWQEVSVGEQGSVDGGSVAVEQTGVLTAVFVNRGEYLGLRSHPRRQYLAFGLDGGGRVSPEAFRFEAGAQVDPLAPIASATDPVAGDGFATDVVLPVPVGDHDDPQIAYPPAGVSWAVADGTASALGEKPRLALDGATLTEAAGIPGISFEVANEGPRRAGFRVLVAPAWREEAAARPHGFGVPAGETVEETVPLDSLADRDPSALELVDGVAPGAGGARHVEVAERA